MTRSERVIAGSYAVSSLITIAGTLGLDARQFEAGLEHSWLGRAGSTLVAFTAQSWIVRWLTAEPDPDIVVIDLTRTATIGPLIRLLDSAVALLQPAVSGATTPALMAGITASVRNEPVRVASLTLLGVILGRSAVIWPAWTEPSAGFLYIVAAVALLGLRETRSARELADTTIGRAVAAILAPPEPPEEKR